MRPRPQRQRSNDEYANYVEHPRYGRGPIYSGLDPDAKVDFATGVITNLHWNATPERRIANTAVEADWKRLNLQWPITHYFDLKLQCSDCGRPFIFFASEQRYWYEALDFPVESIPRHCYPCRAKRQHTARIRQRYEELVQLEHRTRQQAFEIAECYLSLVEEGEFPLSTQGTQRLNRLLNEVDQGKATDQLRERYAALAAKGRAPINPGSRE